MASLDFIENSSKGYGFFWKNRGYIFQNAIPVIFIVILCSLISVTAGAGVLSLREGIIMFPAYAVEGFFLVNLIRYYVYGEAIYIWGKPIPVPVTADRQTKKLQPTMPRSISLHAGVAVYLLIKIASRICLAIWLAKVPGEYMYLGEPSLFIAISSLIVIYASLWALRLFWLYIPISLGFSVSAFMKKISGIENSLYFVGIFFICSVPCWFLSELSLSLASGILGLHNAAILIVTRIFIGSIFYVAVLSILTIAVSAGTYDIMTNTEQNEDTRY
jgi:hypothetical protein